MLLLFLSSENDGEILRIVEFDNLLSMHGRARSFSRPRRWKFWIIVIKRMVTGEENIVMQEGLSNWMGR